MLPEGISPYAAVGSSMLPEGIETPVDADSPIPGVVMFPAAESVPAFDIPLAASSSLISPRDPRARSVGSPTLLGSLGPFVDLVGIFLSFRN